MSSTAVAVSKVAKKAPLDKGKGKESSARMPFANALNFLEIAATTSSPVSPDVASFLSSHLPQLKAPHNPFPRNSTSRDLVKSGKVALQLPSSTDTVTPGEQPVVDQVADRFELDEIEALLAVRALRDGKIEKLAEEDWDAVTAYVFEERMAVIGTVGLLLRCHGEPAHPCHELAASIVPSILTPDFAQTLLESFALRTTQPLPDAVRPSPHNSLFWTKQLIREQKALLEVVFALYYSLQPPDGLAVTTVLDTIARTNWGQRQETFGYFDVETKAIVREIGDLLTVIAVESLNLEDAVDEDHPVPAPGEQTPPPTGMYHPSRLQAINVAIEGLIQSDGARASPILLGWAFVLSRVTTSLTERGVPEAYKDVASTSLRINATAGSQPLFQLYAAHALSPSSAVFDSLLSIFTSSLFGSPHLNSSSTDEPNALGYLSVLRALVTCIPLLVRLTFLSSEQWAGLVDVFAALYGNQAGAQLCSRFWDEYRRDESFARRPDAVGEREIVDLARSRFPVQFSPFVKIVKALSNGTGTASARQDERQDEDARLSAENCFEYLATLDSLTHIVAPPSALAPLPYEIVGYPDNTITYRATRPIVVSRSLTVPPGTLGRLVSEQGRKPVVISWDFPWSGWNLFYDVLEDYATVKRNTTDVFGGAPDVGLPVQWDSEQEHADDITAVLEVFRITVTNDPSLGARLFQHMGSGAGPEGQFDFVHVLLRLLERSLAPQRSIPTKLVSSLLGLLSGLLPAAPGAIWTFLRGSTLLFPTPSPAKWGQGASRHALLQTEKLAGSYPVTLAILSLIRGLVLEEQVSSYVVSPAFETIKQGVLVRALTWVRDEVWTAYGSWRFTNIGEKYQVAKRMVLLYRLVLEQGELSPDAPKGQFDPVVSVVVDALVTHATISQLSPLLFTIGAGPEPIILLRKASRHADALASENLVEAALGLALKLLHLRRRITGSNSSLLETIALSPGSHDSLSPKTELVATLSRFVTAPVTGSTATQAARLLTLLCVGASECQQRPPSFVSLLGGAGRVEKVLTDMLRIAGELNAEESLQVAVWDLLSSVVETQPSLSILLVTGRHYPFGPDESRDKDKSPQPGALVPAKSLPEDPSLALSRTLTPTSFRPLPRTAVGVGLETVGTWEESWKARPALLAAVLRFFDFTWQHLIDYGNALDDFRARPALWDAIVKIAFATADEDPMEDEETKEYCHRTMARAHAVRILALDIQAALQRPGADTSISAKTLIKSLSDRRQLTQALSSAISTSCAPNLHRGIYQLIHETFPDVPIDALRLPPSTHPLDNAREYGTGYLYSLPMLRRKLDGFMSEATMADTDSFDDVVNRTAALNINFSLLEAQISNTRSWRQLLEIVLPLLSANAAASATVVSVAAGLARDVAGEDREGQVMTTVHEERLSILLTMVEVLQAVSSPKVEDLAILLRETSNIFANTALPPLDSVTRRSSPSFHRTLFRIAYFLFRKLNLFGDDRGRSLFQNTPRAELEQPTDTILRIMISATHDLLLLAKASKDVEVEQDLALAVAVVSQVVHSPFVSSAGIWLAYCQSVDLFRSAFDVFVFMEQIDGRPLYAQHILDLCLSMASASPLAAEAMALEGLMTALSNNALSATAEAGEIRVTSIEGERTPQHELWTSMLALVVSLVSALGDSTWFVEQEVTGFVRLYHAQISVAMGWTADSSLTLPGLEETQNAAALMHGVVHRTGSSSPVARDLVEQALHLLQQVVYAILHPNHLVSLIEPVTPEERALVEKDAAATDEVLEKRPVVGSVTLALLQLSRVIVDSLLAYTHAFSTLTKDESEWRMDRAIVYPTAAVTSTEKASIGTLFDLTSFCLDTLRAATPPLIAAAGPPSTSLSTTSPLLPYSSTLLNQNAAQTLETVLLLATTQLALYLFRPDSLPTRASQLLRREIQGELASDLATTVDKAANLGSGGAAKAGERKKGVRFEQDAPSPVKREKGKGDGVGGVSGELVRVLKAFIGRRLVVSDGP